MFCIYFSFLNFFAKSSAFLVMYYVLLFVEGLGFVALNQYLTMVENDHDIKELEQ